MNDICNSHQTFNLASIFCLNIDVIIEISPLMGSLEKKSSVSLPNLYQTIELNCRQRFQIV